MQKFFLILLLLARALAQVSFSNFQANAASGLQSVTITLTNPTSGVSARNVQISKVDGGIETPISLSGVTLTSISAQQFAANFPPNAIPAGGSYKITVNPLYFVIFEQFRNDPPQVCTSPISLVDMTNAVVVGDGSPASCTAAALAAAVLNGGKIKFNCGSQPVTIPLSSPLSMPLNKNTTIDGGNLITLDGQGTTRILEIQSTFDKNLPLVTVQNLRFVRGFTTDVPNTSSTTKGGAAMYRLGGQFQINHCEFIGNVGPVTGQDVAGGAVYSVGGGLTIIVDSTFTQNSCSDGGAIGNLGNSFSIFNSAVVGNIATGSGGNPGNGGNAGGIYLDGANVATIVCGTTIAHNVGHAFGINRKNELTKFRCRFVPSWLSRPWSSFRYYDPRFNH